MIKKKKKRKKIHFQCNWDNCFEENGIDGKNYIKLRESSVDEH